jgi:hypothetical protein
MKPSDLGKSLNPTLQQLLKLGQERFDIFFGDTPPACCESDDLFPKVSEGIREQSGIAIPPMMTPC